MKALVLKNYPDLVYQEVPLPEIGQDEVLVSVQSCGICGSDVHGMDGTPAEEFRRSSWAMKPLE